LSQIIDKILCLRAETGQQTGHGGQRNASSQVKIRSRNRKLILGSVRVGAFAAVVAALATVFFQADQPESYRVVGIDPDIEAAAPGEEEGGLDGFAACEGYVPGIPTEDCDGPAVPANSSESLPTIPPAPPTTTPEETLVSTPPVEAPAALDAIEQQVESLGGVVVPFIDVEGEQSETLAALEVSAAAEDGTQTIVLASLVESVDPVTGEVSSNGVEISGLLATAEDVADDESAALPLFIVEAAFEVPGTDIVLIPADISTAAPNGGGVEASVSGFEMAVVAVDEDGDGELDDNDGLVLRFDGVEFTGEWSTTTTCLACTGDVAAGGEGTGEMVAGGVFLLPNGDVIVVGGLGADDEIVFPEAPVDAVFLATLIDLENDGVFDLSFTAPEGGLEVDPANPTG
jgi:hypothetical protein